MAGLSPSFIECFRRWYEYEKDCNRKALQMLQSVPAGNRGTPAFQRAVGKMAHLVAARHMWLHRLGEVSDRPESWFPPTALDDLPGAVSAIEARWTEYLARLTDAEIEADFTCSGGDGRRYRWQLRKLLTQIFGHAWYHRGQIALLVKDLGGKTVDTDYIFWDRPEVISEELPGLVSPPA